MRGVLCCGVQSTVRDPLAPRSDPVSVKPASPFQTSAFLVCERATVRPAPRGRRRRAPAHPRLEVRGCLCCRHHQGSMDILRLALQRELTADELEHIAQKVRRCLVGCGSCPPPAPPPRGCPLLPVPSGATSEQFCLTHPAGLRVVRCFGGGGPPLR